MKTIRLAEAILFCPGDRPDRFEKALHRADRVILDLEDSVAPQSKEAARLSVIMALPALPEGVIVRVNASTSHWQAEDMQALRQLSQQRGVAPLIMLPKAEHIRQL